MVINEIKYFPKELIFRIPFQTSQTVYRKKKVFIVELKDELNNSAFGECAPLPEFGTETAEQAGRKLYNLKNSSFQLVFNNFLSNEIINRLTDFSNFPSLKFAIEQALFTLISKREKGIFQNLYKTEFQENINVNAVVGFGNSNEVIEKTERLLKEGFKTIKLKCGRENFEDEYKIIKEIRKHFGSKINLRIDINGKWSLEAAKNNLTKLEAFNLEYAEQPVNTAPEMIELSKSVGINIAADESVKSYTGAKYLLENGIKFLVIKPTVAGGILNTIKIINEAEKNNANVIISSSFESAAGKSVLAYLASLTNHNLAHGLGIDNFFEKNIAEDFYPVQNGVINFDINNFPPEFNF